MTLSTDLDRANAILSGKAHQIDGVLYQYWLTVTPVSEKDDVAALSASAYIILPTDGRGVPPPTVAQAPPGVPDASPPAASAAIISVPNAGKDALISPLHITSPSSLGECAGGSVQVREAAYMTGTRPCSLLQTEANADAIVFFLQHQANHGLVRLAGDECRDRTTARIARKGEPLSFPITKTTTSSRDWSETYEWQIDPDLDTYYAVVVTDPHVARRVANHMDELPMRCSAAVRPGLEDEQLRQWLSEFAMLAARSSRYVDWRGIRVRDVL